MSLNINWPEIIKRWLDPDGCKTHLTELLNSKLPPDFPITNIRVKEFDLTQMTEPDFELTGIEDIRDEFLVFGGMCRSIHSPPPPPSSPPISPSASPHSLIDAAAFLFQRPAGSWKEAIFQDGIELSGQVKLLDGQMKIECEAEAVLNIPSSAFLALPFKFSLTRLSLNSPITLGLPASFDRLYLSLPTAPTEFAFQISVDVGDAEKHALRNVAKIEKFLQEQAKILLIERLVYPKFVEIPILSRL